MTQFEVTFMCNAVDDLDTISAAFYDNFDGVISERDGRLRVTVEFSAVHGSAGAAEVVVELHRMGITPTRVDRDLVDASEIAERLDCTRQAVQQWATGRQRCGFPLATAVIGAKRIWEWADVAEWAAGQFQTFDQPFGLTHLEATALDAALGKSSIIDVEAVWESPIVLRTGVQVSGQKASSIYAPTATRARNPLSARVS